MKKKTKKIRMLVIKTDDNAEVRREVADALDSGVLCVICGKPIEGEYERYTEESDYSYFSDNPTVITVGAHPGQCFLQLEDIATDALEVEPASAFIGAVRLRLIDMGIKPTY